MSYAAATEDMEVTLLSGIVPYADEVGSRDCNTDSKTVRCAANANDFSPKKKFEDAKPRVNKRSRKGASTLSGSTFSTFSNFSSFVPDALRVLDPCLMSNSSPKKLTAVCLGFWDVNFTGQRLYCSAHSAELGAVRVRPVGRCVTSICIRLLLVLTMLAIWLFTFRLSVWK